MKKESKNKKYQLIDIYDVFDIVGYYDTKKELRQAGNKWMKSTDGECHLIVGVMETKEVLKND